MKQTIYLILYVAILIIVGCTDKGGVKHVRQASDSLYTEEWAMDIYDREPEQALQIIDSAEVVGNVSDFRAELLRARVYAYPGDAMNLDTARQMGVALLKHDSVKGSADNRMEVLRLLTDVARVHLDYPEQVKWASELATLCREQGDERLRVGEHGSGMTEALRTESEIGIVLTHLGQRNEGFQMLDKVIDQLDSQRHFAELDACIIAMKRKMTALSLLPDITMPGDSMTVEQRHQDIIRLAERFITKLDDYEQHPQDYADGSDRQAAIDYFHLSKERIGAAFSQGSEFPTIADFINHCRLEYAKELLAVSTEMTVDDIASASGFGTRRTFSRLFKERFCLHPARHTRHSQHPWHRHRGQSKGS